jgi:hypothetical protein
LVSFIRSFGEIQRHWSWIGCDEISALRALKRRLSDVVYRQMGADAKLARTGPGGHVGATLQSSAAEQLLHG